MEWILAPSEKKWIVIFSVIVLGVTTLPFVLGFWQEGSDWRFTGFFLGVEDGNSYIAKMLLGSQGEWLFSTPYTAYPQSGFLAFLPYLLLGKLTAPPGQHAQLVALFQFFRWAGGFVMIAATYRFVGYFLSEPGLRKLGMVIAVLGGGLGWLNLFGFQDLWGSRLPLEFYSPETFGFLSLFTLPHLAMARGLLLLSILAYWRGYDYDYRITEKFLNGLMWIILGLMQPLTVVVGWFVIGVDILIRLVRSRKIPLSSFIRQKGVVNGAVMVLCSAPIVIYTVISFALDPFLKIWSAQNIIQSPPPTDYLLGYVVLIPFVYLGIRHIMQEKQMEGLVITAWILLLPVLAYFPYNLQRRLPEGTWAAVVVLAIIGLRSMQANHRRLGIAFIAITFLSAILIYTGSIFTVLQTNRPVFRPTDEISSFVFLAERVDKFPVVLAAYDTSNAIPAWAAVRTVIGHGPESVNLEETKREVKECFDAKTTGDRRNIIIDQYSVRYLIWGPAERELGSWDPGSWSGLERIYQNSTYQIFEVKQ